MREIKAQTFRAQELIRRPTVVMSASGSEWVWAAEPELLAEPTFSKDQIGGGRGQVPGGREGGCLLQPLTFSGFWIPLPGEGREAENCPAACVITEWYRRRFYLREEEGGRKPG